MGQNKEPRESRERREDGQRIIGDYELIRKLGRGGFSTVYLARHRILARWSLVALKHLQTPLDSSEAREQFIAETRLLEQLNHPHILPLLDAGIDQEEFPYLITPYAAGGSLRQRLRQVGGRPLPLEEILQIIGQIGAALQYAHERGIIHRDLKPENILFDADGKALLADFGMALLLSSRSLEAVSLSGTPAYMAPEQFRGQVSRASDQYALACIAYELSTGRRVFEEQEPLALMHCHVEQAPEPPRHLNPHLPPAVEAAILRGLAKEREERYSSVSEFVAALLAGAGTPAQRAASEVWPGAIWGEPAAQLTPGAGGVTEMLVAEDEPQEQPERLINQATRSLPPSAHHSESLAPRGARQRETWQRFPHLRRLQARRGLPAERNEGQQPLAAPARRANSRQIFPEQPLGGPRQSARSLLAQQAALPAMKPRERQPNKARATRRRGLIAAVIAALLLMLLAGLLVAYADPLALGPLGTALPIGAPLATVHITPASVLLTRQYLITGVTGKPDAAQRQIQARRLSATVSSPAKTVQATGHGMTAGTQAHGTITFYNGTGLAQTVPKGTILAVGGGISIVTDEAASMPPSPDLDHRATSTVPAHVLQPGSIGNLPAGALNQYCCDEALAIQAISGPFTGGQDPQPYTYVQQSDIDNVVNPLKANLLSQAQQQFQRQVHSGERVVGPNCSTNIKSDHRAGDHATRVTVSLVITCSGAAYNQQAAFDMAAALLRREATHDPGPAYSLVGQINSTIVDASLNDPQSGRLIVTVKAEGRWTYRFTEGTQQHLAQLIAGKSRSQALQLLQRQPGIKQADISMARSDSGQLPSDPAFIAIIIENST